MKKKAGRPRKILDEQLIVDHASKGYTMEELAAVTGVHIDTLRNNYSNAIKRGISLRDASLRRKQVEVAESGNPTMLIWLGKQYLEQRDKNEVSGKDGSPLPVQIVTNFQLPKP